MADDPSAPNASTNPYLSGTDAGSAPLVVVGQNMVQAINNLAQVTASATVSISSSIVNVFRPATSSASPVTTPVNNLGTAATAILASSTIRHGLIFHNPASTVTVYVFQSTIATAPSLSSLGGAMAIFPGATLAFPTVEYANMNTAFSAFAGTGTGNPLTILEFR